MNEMRFLYIIACCCYLKAFNGIERETDLTIFWCKGLVVPDEEQKQVIIETAKMCYEAMRESLGEEFSYTLDILKEYEQIKEELS